MTKLNNITVFACVAFALGIWSAGVYNWNIFFLFPLVMLILVTVLWRIIRGYQQVFWPIIGLFFMAGMIYYSQESIVRSDNISHYIGQTVKIKGIVEEVPAIIELDAQSKQVRYVVNVEYVELEQAGSLLHSSGRVRVNVRYKNNGSPAAYGDRITVYGKVQELHGYNNPGQIDMTLALKRQNIMARMSVQGDNVKVFSAFNTYSWRVVMANWQEGIIQALQKVMPVNDAAILTAVLFGGYKGIDKNVITDFATTGLIHILSVSGAHMALVAGLIRWLGNQFRLGSLTSATLAAIAVILYACISGLTPPVIRSAVMGIISLMAIVLGRESYAPAALSVTALGMLVYQPLLLYDISFQLSFGATAGLVFIYRQTLEFMAHWPSWLAEPLAVTLSAQLGVLPVIAWYFNSFSLISFIANIFVLPIVELVIILGLAGVVLYTIIPVVGNIVFVISSLLIGNIILLTQFLASVPLSSVYVPSIGIAGSVMYYILLAWTYGWCPFSLPRPRQLINQKPMYCVIAAIMIVVLITGYSAYPRHLSVHFIDVGQGDATLVITPHGKAVLVDTGGSFNGTNFDIGERVVAPYLKHYGVTTVDYLILTHGHQDHAGGAAGVAANVRVNKVLLPREEYSQAVQSLVHTKPAVLIIPTYIDQIFELDGVTFCIYPAVAEGDRSRQKTSDNEISSVVRVSYGQHSFLITGDLEAKGEAVLLNKEIKPCTVLKVGHHGAKTSTTAPFLKAVAPNYAVISVGYGNRFGHPHEETIKRLAERKTVVYRTDIHGAVVFTSNGRDIKADTYIK